MKTVNFEKTTVLCTFCLPHKNKKRPRRDAFCFATRILPQAFFVQAVCYKCFSYKNFATSIFRTSVLLQVFLQAKVLLQVWLYNCFTYKSFEKYQASTKLFFATSVFSHTASFICCKAHVSSFNAMQQYQPKSRQRFSLCKGVSGLAESAKHLCNASVTLLLNFVFLYGCITNLYVYCDALSLTKQFVFL